MKKNKIMRLASALLVLTLLTTCAISGTFAKYTTSTSGSDTARVAYWGFNQNASTTIDLFDTTYTNVKSANDDNVIAPGTGKTSAFAFGYTNNTDKNITAPEVAYTLTVDAKADGSYTALDANDSFRWTLQKGEGNATEYNTVADLINAIKALSGDSTGTKQYAAGELPAAFTSADEAYTIGWKWAFDGNDAGDTTMGNAETLENVKLSITITATQVD